MKLIKQIWTMPNMIEFIVLWKGKEYFFKASYYQVSNSPYVCNGYTINRTAIPFFVFKDLIFLGAVGLLHDEMMRELYPDKVNDPSLKIETENGQIKCVNFRKAECLSQQGRCFVFQIEEEKICFITTWWHNATLDMFNKIKEVLKADHYYYIWRNEFKKV